MVRKCFARRLRDGKMLAIAAVSTLALLASAVPALATPNGEYAHFAQCPLGNAEVVTCVYENTTSGEFAIGSTKVPLTKPIVLQGGLVQKGSELTFVGAANGETLSKMPETVPGGLLKVVAPESWPGWLQSVFNGFINKGLTGVTSTTELVGTPSLNVFAALSGQGTALMLPVRVHLENPFLGSGCYIGSASHPILVNLTTGTTSPPAPNEPITGSPGQPEFKSEGELLILRENSLVDNSFSVPTAEGCGGIFSFLVDPAVDLEEGLPSAAGHNTAILSGNQEIAAAFAVRASE